MTPFRGMDLTEYFPRPLRRACAGLLNNDDVIMHYEDPPLYAGAIHWSGQSQQPDPTTALYDIDWYTNKFLPRMKEYKKGDLVWNKVNVTTVGRSLNRTWAVMDDKLYDLTPYFYTKSLLLNDPKYSFLDKAVENLFSANSGEDIKTLWNAAPLNESTKAATLNCLDNAFYIGKLDFRLSPRCTVNNFLLLSFTVILAIVLLKKFLAALQLGAARLPSQQDKYVVCLVPAYTEGEESICKAINSLAALNYDDRQKLLFIVCDGVVRGQKDSETTPRIVLDILGVDRQITPPRLAFNPLVLVLSN